MDSFPNALNADAMIELHKQRAGWVSGGSESTRWESVSGVPNARGEGAVRLAAALAAGTYRAKALPDPASATGGGFGFRLRASAPPSACPAAMINDPSSPLASSPPPQNGTWTSACDSRSRPGAYSREYSFTLARRSKVTIDLTSNEDAYLYLRGVGRSSEFKMENDDGGDGTNARITATVSPSSVDYYLIEATTDERGRTGAFTLAITVSPIQDPADADALRPGGYGRNQRPSDARRNVDGRLRLPWIHIVFDSRKIQILHIRARREVVRHAGRDRTGRGDGYIAANADIDAQRSPR